MSVMNFLKFLIGGILVLLIAGFAFLRLSGERRVLADMTSPSGDWRVEVIGTNQILGGVEVVAHVHTSDGRMTSRGVIDLLPDWEVATEQYREASNRSSINEVEARLGDEQDGTMLLKADYIR